jgi:hypothetical protein
MCGHVDTSSRQVPPRLLLRRGRRYGLRNGGAVSDPRSLDFGVLNGNLRRYLANTLALLSTQPAVTQSTINSGDHHLLIGR